MKRFSFGDYELNTMDSELLFRGEALALEPQVYCILFVGEVTVLVNNNLSSDSEDCEQLNRAEGAGKRL